MALTIVGRTVRPGAIVSRQGIRRHGTVLFIFSLVILLAAFTAVVSPDFRQFNNINDVLRQSIVLGLVTIGQSFVLIGGGIDMSVGMSARAIALGAAVTMSDTALQPSLVLVLALVAGGLIGAVNALLVTRIGAAPFIVTLGMYGALQGVSLAITHGAPTGAVPNFLITAYDAKIGAVPISVLAMAVLWLLAWFVLQRGRFGRNVYAVGGSSRVAHLAAINVPRVQTLTYVVSGVLAAAAGLFLLARSGVGDPSLGNGLEFQSIVAAAIGGISLYGGRGSIAGALGAVLLVSLSSNVIDLLHVSAYYQDLVLGVIVLMGVAVYKPRATG
jgi:ribose transport system permease protein